MSHEPKERVGAVVLMAMLHLLCCGLPLLLFSGVSLGFLVPKWPVIGVMLAVVGVIGFVWYLRRGCATCPRNEGRCTAGGRCEPRADPPVQRHETEGTRAQS